MMLNFKFHFEKTLEAAAVLLREHHGHRMEYIRLLKLLYIVDRELLTETGRTLTGDKPYAMKRGPVLSRVYDLIRGQGAAAEVQAWNKIVAKDGYEVVLNGDIGRDHLTGAEEQKLREVSARYQDVDSEGLSELTHGFEEWNRAFDPANPNSSFQIQWELAIAPQLRAVYIEAIESKERERESVDAAFRS